MSVAAAVLAAGRGSRLGDDASPAKPLLSFRGRPLVAHALDAAVGSGLGPVVLVVGHEADAVAAVAPEGVEVVHNDRWADGISSSLHAALRSLESRPVDGVVVGLADQPLVGADAWRRIGAAHADGATLAVATYGGRRANPVLLARARRGRTRSSCTATKAPGNCFATMVSSKCNATAPVRPTTSTHWKI